MQCTEPKADLNKSYCNHSLCLYISVPCPSMQHSVGLSDFLPHLFPEPIFQSRETLYLS